MIKIKIISSRSSDELQEKAQNVLNKIQDSGNKLMDTDVAGRASDSGNEWIMTIVYDDTNKSWKIKIVFFFSKHFSIK